MPLEPNVNDIGDLNEAWPVGNTDTVLPGTELVQHVRNLKIASRGSFPELASTGGAVTATADEFNYLQGVTSNIQTQIDNRDAPPAWIDAPIAEAFPTAYAFEPAENTRVFVFINQPLIDTILVRLPRVSGLSDGDSLHICTRETALIAGSLFFVERFDVAEPLFIARLPDGSWDTVNQVISSPAAGNSLGRLARWPVVKAVYVAAEGAWRVWCERGEFNGI